MEDGYESRFYRTIGSGRRVILPTRRSTEIDEDPPPPPLVSRTCGNNAPLLLLLFPVCSRTVSSLSRKSLSLPPITDGIPQVNFNFYRFISLWKFNEGLIIPRVERRRKKSTTRPVFRSLVLCFVVRFGGDCRMKTRMESIRLIYSLRGKCSVLGILRESFVPFAQDLRRSSWRALFLPVVNYEVWFELSRLIVVLGYFLFLSLRYSNNLTNYRTMMRRSGLLECNIIYLSFDLM